MTRLKLANEIGQVKCSQCRTKDAVYVDGSLDVGGHETVFCVDCAAAHHGANINALRALLAECNNKTVQSIALSNVPHKIKSEILRARVSENIDKIIEHFYGAEKTEQKALTAGEHKLDETTGSAASVDSAVKTLIDSVLKTAKTSVDRSEVESIVKESVKSLEDKLITGSVAAFKALEEKLTAALDEIKKSKPRVLTVVAPSGKKTDVGFAHAAFDDLLKCIGLRLNTYLIGAAGTGKTYAAEQAAKALDLPYYSQSVCQQSSAAVLTGFPTANGANYMTNFRRAFESGGVFLLDEIDNGNPNVLSVVNAAVSVSAGQAISFNNEMVTKHADFVLVAAANTYGRGADRQYVGRNALDAATLDRFVFLEWNIDEKLETAVAHAQGVPESWLLKVRRYRKASDDLKLRVVISPRATFYGGALLNGGFSESRVDDMALFKGVEKDTREKIVARAKETV